MAGPYFFGSEGWRLVPGHFAERHGLIIIIALGESIVAIGVGAEVGLTWGIAAAAALGIAAGGGDVVDSTSTSSRWSRPAGSPARPRGPRANELARDSYSYLHFPMVAGIILFALGLKKTLGHVDDPLELVPAFALLGGVAALPAGAGRLPLSPCPLDQPPAAGARAAAARHWSRPRPSVPALAILALVGVLALGDDRLRDPIGYGEGRARVRHGDEAPAAR